MRCAAMRYALTVAALGLMVGTSRAGITINVNQVGSDVVATGGGTIDLTDLTVLTLNIGVHNTINPTIGQIFQGPDGNLAVDAYKGAAGPSPWGPGGGTFASSGSGNAFGVEGDGPFIVVPHNYHSGTMLNATNEWANATFASLGVNPGTYTYTWGTGDHADSLTVNIGTPTPEPSTLIGGALAVAAALGGAWRQRRANGKAS